MYHKSIVSPLVHRPNAKHNALILRDCAMRCSVKWRIQRKVVTNAGVGYSRHALWICF